MNEYCKGELSKSSYYKCSPEESIIRILKFMKNNKTINGEDKELFKEILFNREILNKIIWITNLEITEGSILYRKTSKGKSTESGFFFIDKLNFMDRLIFSLMPKLMQLRIILSTYDRIGISLLDEEISALIPECEVEFGDEESDEDNDEDDDTFTFEF